MGILTVEGIVPDSFLNKSEFYLQICDHDQAKAAKFFDGTDINDYVFSTIKNCLCQKLFLSLCNISKRNLIEISALEIFC